MAIPHGFIQDLLQRVDVVDVVGRYVQLKKAGANYSGLCPFHSEKSPSFSVSPSKQFYHCFGCGKNGDAIRFLMEHNGMSFIEAVQELAQQHGIVVPDDRPADPRERARIEAQKKKKNTLVDVLEKAATDYKAQLKQSPIAIDYLKGRGLSGAIAARFGLGYAPAGWRHLSSVFPDYTDPLLEEAGLVIHSHDAADNASSDNKRYDRFRHRVMFPIRNVKGDCIGFGGRVLGDEKPKYLNSPETPVFSKGHELYGLFEARDALRQHGYALVTEGYMDVVALAQLGFANAVATLGTACTPDHVHKLFRYTDQVVFSFDGDNAGRRAAQKALVAALPYATDTRSVKFLFLPSEHDPDSYIRAYGPESFDAMVKSAMPLSQFLQQVSAEDCDLDTAEGRARMTSQARPLWQALPAGALRSQLLLELAQTAHMPAEALQQLWSQSSAATPPAAHAPAAGTPTGTTSAPERKPFQKEWKKQRAPWSTPQPRMREQPTSRADHALRLLMLNMQFWERLAPDTLTLLCELPDPHGVLFRWLDEQFLEHGAMAWGALAEQLPHVNYGHMALARIADYRALGLQPTPQEASAELRSVLTGLKAEHLDQALDQAASSGDTERWKQLMAQKNALQ